MEARPQLEIPIPNSDTPLLETITVSSSSSLIDSDDGRWYRIDGKRSDEQPAVVLLYAQKDNTDFEVESLIERIKLQDIGVSAQLLHKFDKEGRGELIYDGQHYKFNADDSDDARYTLNKPGSQPINVSYYRFDCVEDDDLAIIVFEWGGNKYEVLHVGWVDSKLVHLK